MEFTAFAQTGSPAGSELRPAYSVRSIPQPMPVVAYLSSAPMRLDFAGTWLLPKAHGDAQVTTVPGGLQIEVQLKGLCAASDLGPAYLTYVLWAGIPGGKFHNLGEVSVTGSAGAVAATTELTGFAMFVTAEPYFAVTEPSDAVVLRIATAPGSLRYKFAPDLLPLLRDRETPLDLVQARNAVRIARRVGAERLASAQLQTAVELLSQAEREYRVDDRWQTVLKARQAIEAAEAARMIAARAASE
jgi:hypothetical protein